MPRPARGAEAAAVFAVRFTPEEIAVLEKIAQHRQLSRSDVIRLAVARLAGELGEE